MNRNKLKSEISFHKLALLSTLFILGITLYVFWETDVRLNERNKVLFEIRVDMAQKLIEKRMVDYIQILKGAQALFNLKDSVTRHEWSSYFKIVDIEKNYPGIQGIGYAVMVSGNSLPSFEKSIQEEGFPFFHVWPEGRRDLLTSIVYLEPFNSRNIRAFGYDMWTDSTRKIAMKKAMALGKPALSGGVVLVQESTEALQKGFNLYLPIYKKGSNTANEKERIKNIIGFVYSPFRMNDLMKGILGNEYNDLDISIIEGDFTSEDPLLYRTVSPQKENEKNTSPLQKDTSLTIAGHVWQLHYQALPGFGADKNFTFYLLGGGLLVSFLVFIIILSYGYIQKSTYLKQLITDNASAAIFILNKYGFCTFMNPAAENLIGYSFQEVAHKPLFDLIHRDTEEAPSKNLISLLLDKAESRNLEDVFLNKEGNGINVSINSKLFVGEKEEKSILLEVRDIEQEKIAKNTLTERNKTLQTLNNIGKNLSAELKLKKLLQIITDSCTDLTEAQFGAFFYNNANEKEESLMLYTISGVDPGFFNKFPAPRNTPIFSPTFHGEGIIRSDDITKDSRYGHNAPYKGIPEGHLPVKSYLAVPVISRSGLVIGSLIFGHGKAGIFSKKSEEVVVGIASQAAIAIDNSQLFETITSKNKELIKINNDLDTFVYTASHDLKAPVLNIEGLMYVLDKAIKEGRTDKIEGMVDMINSSIQKFKETIQGLTEVAKINKNIDDEIISIDLKELIEDIVFSIQDSIDKAGVNIQTQLKCPSIKFSKSNLKSLLLNLITNAIKYRSPDRSPKVVVSCRAGKKNIILRVEDNGMGIPLKHQSKIFLMFKRVHTHVEGTGVGLYLVKRIVDNYGGKITVESEENKGSTFTIKLPQQ